MRCDDSGALWGHNVEVRLRGQATTSAFVEGAQQAVNSTDKQGGAPQLMSVHTYATFVKSGKARRRRRRQAPISPPPLLRITRAASAVACIRSASPPPPPPQTAVGGGSIQHEYIQYINMTAVPRGGAAKTPEQQQKTKATICTGIDKAEQAKQSAAITCRNSL